MVRPMFSFVFVGSSWLQSRRSSLDDDDDNEILQTCTFGQSISFFFMVMDLVCTHTRRGFFSCSFVS